MSDIICGKCGGTKFEVYCVNGLSILRCFNCEKTLNEVLENNGIIIKGINKE